MGVLDYRRRWHGLIKSGGTAEDGDRLARQIAASFLDGFLKDGSCGLEHISLLCEMGTHRQLPQVGQSAARALFGTIIERLCDEFEELPADTYNLVMAQILTHCRQLPEGAAIDRALAHERVDTRERIVERIVRLRDRSEGLAAGRHPDRIFVLSRVTVGADVAVTSIILQRLAESFPGAELVLLGTDKCKEIFAGFRDLSIAPLDYRRNGGLFERLQSWHRAREIVSGFGGTGDGSRSVLLDPDSRLSQLGLLPLLPENRYFYFDSRSAAAPAGGLSIGALTNKWLDRILSRSAFTLPGVWPRSEHLTRAEAFCRQLRRNGARRLVVINFGVGGNSRKKVGARFERALLVRLVSEPGTAVLLDRGHGKNEMRCADDLMSAMRSSGHQVHGADLAFPAPDPAAGCIIGLRLGIGELAALIQNGDEYIGYDSAGQHMAAALSVPCVTVFAGSNSMRFIQRWAALGAGKRHIVHVDTLTDPGAVDTEEVIERVMAARGSA